MSKWFERHPVLLARESELLSSNGDYKEDYQIRDNLFVSSGKIITRVDGKTKRFPIAIIYPEATPYALPRVFLLEASLSEEEGNALAALDEPEVTGFFEGRTFIYYARHQNVDGSLCLLEQDNLDRLGAEFYDAHSVISRVTEWLIAIQTGATVPEGAEVELYSHYPLRNSEFFVLLGEHFYSLTADQGKFFLSRVANVDRMAIYLGAFASGVTAGNLQYDSSDETLTSMPDGLDTRLKIETNTVLRNEKIAEGEIIEGYWWRVSKEPAIFRTGDELLTFLEEAKYGNSTPATLLWEGIKARPETLLIGLCFTNRKGRLEWLMLELVKERPDNLALILGSNPEEVLRDFDVRAIQTEKFTSESHQIRNEGRIDPLKVKARAVTVIGCGALGGEIADSLGKAGVGLLRLIDSQILLGHNSIRHLAGILSIGLPKVLAVAKIILEHNPFIQVNTIPADILKVSLETYLPPGQIGISSIAEDNVEAYLNEMAVYGQRTVFYARALRGGKAARIFRVIPGQDACFHCLSLYRKEKHSSFIDIPEDETLPTLTNECNNPIRPSSAADLKFIAALASKIVLEHLQAEQLSDTNHWVFTSELLPNVSKVDAGIPYVVESRNLAPHRDCGICAVLGVRKVKVVSTTLQFMKQLVQKTPGIETGGILVGRHDADGAIIIENASGPGPNAVCSATRFEREVEYCQLFLDQAAQQGQIYLGEWHSHPGQSNTPSYTDLNSLHQIAVQPVYLTDCPVMIILTRDGAPSCTVHPANAAYYKVELAVRS